MKTIKVLQRLQVITGIACLWLFVFFVGGECLAQVDNPGKKYRITLNYPNTTVATVLKAIEQQTGLHFFYNNNSVKLDQKIAVVVKNELLDSVLDKLLGEAYRYIFEKDLIILTPRSAITKGQLTILGIVKDESNKPFAGASVVEAGTGNGIATDADGRFILTVKRGCTINISFMGYKTHTFKIKDGVLRYNVKLKPDTKEVEEVTVIGYGERNQKNIIGAVSGVKGDDIKEIPSASIENLLQGRMAGVEITNSSGAPGGGGAIIAIRGYNSMIDQNSLRMSDYGEPLYVIDGVPVQGFTSPITGSNTLSSIDPASIESIEVLKDAASAAIYGSRAGRGVILITTKKGREGRAKFSANVSYSLSQLPTAPEQTGGKAVRNYLYKSLENLRRPYKDPLSGLSQFPENMLEGYNTAQYGGTYNSFWQSAAIGYKYDPYRPPLADVIHDSLNPLFNNSTNWYEYMFRTARVLNANIQAIGGSDKVTYLIGAGFYDEKGIVKGSDFSRINFITNLNAKPIRNLSVDSRIAFSYMGRHRGGSTGGSKIEYLSVDPRKASSLSPASGPILDKMLQSINLTNERNENYDIRTSLNLEYNILQGLRFRTSGSVHMTIQALNLFQPRTIVEEKLNKTTGETARNLNWVNENILTFNKSFNDVHNLEMMFGLSFQKGVENIISAEGFGSISEKIHYIYKGFPELPPTGFNTNLKILQHAFTDRLEQALLSSFGRIAYNYNYRYLMEATLRRDGSSVFGSNNKYATFPAFAIGWGFSEEPFMKRMWWLNQGKLRISYGRSGETYPDPYKAFGLLQPGGEYYGRPKIETDNSLYGGMINRDLKWVLHDQYDIGLDLAFLDYALKIKVDYYNRRSHGILAASKLPKSIYLYETKVVNANDAANEGIEFELQADLFRPEKKRDFSWRTRFNISHNRNYLVNTFDNKDVGLPNGIPYHMLGRPLYMLWTFEDGPVYGNKADIPDTYDSEGRKHILYLADKVYPFGVGMKEIKDLNGDYKIDYLDQRYQGTTLPKASGGWSNEFKYKNFDLTMLFTFTLNRKMLNAAKWESLNPEEAASKQLLIDLQKVKFWEKPGDENIPGILPMLSAWDKTMLQYYPIFSSNIENVSYLKLKTLTLGYTFPTELTKKMHISGLRLFLTGEYLFTLTNYSGPDPETVPFMGAPDYAGKDYFRAYPLARKMTFGLSINL